MLMGNRSEEIPPFKLVPQPLNEEARALPPFQWAGKEIGTRHQLGGAPTIPNGEGMLKCKCGQDMTFYAQLDSINDDFVIADCGVIHVFVCFECVEVKSLIQST